MQVQTGLKRVGVFNEPVFIVHSSPQLSARENKSALACIIAVEDADSQHLCEKGMTRCEEGHFFVCCLLCCVGKINYHAFPRDLRTVLSGEGLFVMNI